MITDAQVEEVRSRADIVVVIGEVVPLKKAGREYKGRCPFHEERTPSFYVAPDKGVYKCWGCGASGDVFTFVMKRSGLDFPEAVRHVAGRSGVELREVRGRAPEEDPDRPYHEVNAFARDFYRKCLLDPETGDRARDYLASRGVDDETAERFGLGYAPDGWRALREQAHRLGIADEMLAAVGLLSTSERSNEPYDRFRDRIVFPIEDAAGRTVAFGGRVLGKAEGGPKYVNSPESPVYHKGEILYGLSWARHAIRREGAALVVEGYMDAVSLAARGLEHVVAPLGTAFTETQARLLTRYTKRVLLLFDSDAAGLKATFRAGDVLLAAGLHPAVVTLPPGEDPDTLVRKEGAAGLRHYLDDAVDVLDRKLQILDERDTFATIEGTRRALDKLVTTVRAASDPTLRDIYVARVTARTGVKAETLEAELAQGTGPAAPRPGSGAPGRRGRGRPPRGAAPPPALLAMGPERKLLTLLTRNPGWVELVAERLGPEDFLDPACRAIFGMLLENPALKAPPPGMDPGAAARLEEILGDPEAPSHGERMLHDIMDALRTRRIDARLRELDQELGSGTGRAPEEVLEEQRRLRAERPGGGAAWARTARALGRPELRLP